MIRRIFAAIVVLTFLSSPIFAACQNNAVDIRGEFGQLRFKVDVADTTPLRTQGLMHVQSMPQLHGMIFVFPKPQFASFWMKNTLIPLDLLFIGANGKIRKIHENAVPHSLDGIKGGHRILAVLEINGGLSDKFGIKAGDVIRHPAFSEHDPIWSCDDNS